MVNCGRGGKEKKKNDWKELILEERVNERRKKGKEREREGKKELVSK